tara:strand:- start:190 stop:549 length:360 start_codon:yes stop_codon:yes gene_type:complete
MNFYKTVCITALVILVISLAFIGSAMASSSKKMTFPPNLSQCPDNYVYYQDNKTCVNTENSGTYNSIDCGEISFEEDKYNTPGIGTTSGACAKKKVAIGCLVDWDGLTNNPNVCYSTNI